MDYDMLERCIIVIYVLFAALLSLIAVAGFISIIVNIHNQLDPTYAKKVEQESLYIAKCKSVDGIHAITNDVKYCYKDGKVIEIE